MDRNRGKYNDSSDDDYEHLIDLEFAKFENGTTVNFVDDNPEINKMFGLQSSSDNDLDDSYRDLVENPNRGHGLSNGESESDIDIGSDIDSNSSSDINDNSLFSSNYAGSGNDDELSQSLDDISNKEQRNKEKKKS
eukprot:Anaeramoba_flamelloidesc28965_g1_i2.p1 GENE.c28965_g1_i2~~c28965_g1_i2.p1  ORF type:complete len:136 (+),score=40.89 c28965_g1_i2:119-526(+)